MKFIPVIKAEFPASLLMIFRNHETFLIIINVIKTVVLLHIFVENGNTFSIRFTDKQKFKIIKYK